MMVRPAARVVLLWLAVLLPLATAAGSADADEAAANACAAQLPQDARTIFAAVLPQLSPGADLRSLVVSNTRRLAIAGTISRSNARASAMAAGKCLRLVGSP